jgi:hypothetical protein
MAKGQAPDPGRLEGTGRTGSKRRIDDTIEAAESDRPPRAQLALGIEFIQGLDQGSIRAR